MASVQGVDEALRISKFEVGDLVFAKLKGYPPWPSKINQIESFISGGKEKIRYNVFFYGTHQSSILRSSSLFHYDTYAKSIVDKWGRKPKFHDALKELEREMMDKVTYLNQLRTTTPDTQWCHGFNTACESLVQDIDEAQEKVTSKNHRRPKDQEVQDIEDEIMDESRELGYEVMYIERIPFPDTPESLIVLSLSFNKDWVKEESKKIKEEERMKNCYVRIEPLPSKYAHLEPNKANDIKLKTEENLFGLSSRSTSSLHQRKPVLKEESKQPTLKVEPIFQGSQVEDAKRDFSDDSDVEAVETCPVCRLCFFSQTDLRNHEKSVHGSISTAESLFNRLVSGESDRKSQNRVSSWKEGYPLDTIM